MLVGDRRRIDEIVDEWERVGRRVHLVEEVDPVGHLPCFAVEFTDEIDVHAPE